MAVNAEEKREVAQRPVDRATMTSASNNGLSTVCLKKVVTARARGRNREVGCWMLDVAVV